MTRIARGGCGWVRWLRTRIGYRELLAGPGLTPNGVVRKLWELGRLSDWMICNELCPEELWSAVFDSESGQWFPQAHVRVLRHADSEQGTGSRQQVRDGVRIIVPIPKQLL